jgi:hypothetical protein
MENESVVPLVEGEVVPVSARKLLLNCVISELKLLPLSSALLWLWWTETPIPLVQWNITELGAFIGFVLLILCIVAPVGIIRQLLIRRERLIFGGRFIQIVIMKGDQESVRCQIPYTNMESAFVAKEKGHTIVAIQLKSLDDPNTYNSDQDKDGFYAFQARRKKGLCDL